MALDYTDTELDSNSNILNSPMTKDRGYSTAASRDVLQERTPYLNPMALSKGTIQVTLGGLTTFKDSTGGTTIFTYDPKTGTITINGGIIINQTSNLGTINDTTLSGTSRNTGTLTLGIGTIGTIFNSLFSNGTINNPVIGTPAVSGGTLITSTINNSTVGTPSIVGGTTVTATMNNSVIGTSSIVGGTINPSVYKTNGTSGVTGTFTYLTSGTIPGTIMIMGGIVTTIS